MLKDFEVGRKGLPVPMAERNFNDLDAVIQSLVIESDRPLPMMNRQDAEAAAAEGIWIIARILIHT